MLYKACKTDLTKQLAHPKVTQPKLGAYSAPSLLLVSITHPARMPDGPAKRPGSDRKDGANTSSRWSSQKTVTVIMMFDNSTKAMVRSPGGEIDFFDIVAAVL